jgi:CHAT domain-containing protein/tetratricopeptide (TPR) repeat protein
MQSKPLWFKFGRLAASVMTKFFLSLLLGGFLIICFSQDIPINNNPGSLPEQYRAAEQIYQEAQKLSLHSKNDSVQLHARQLYQQALYAFEKLQEPIHQAGNDSLSFFLHLHTGSIYDSLDNFDSAFIFYTRADKMADRSTLCSRLGTMHSRKGNYRQAKNYFEKAISLLADPDSEDKAVLISYKINIASLLIRLEEYSKAKLLYESMLPNERFSNEIYYNLGIIDLHLDEPLRALGHFRRVKNVQGKRSIDLFHSFAVAFSAVKQTDSAAFYYDKAINENAKWNGSAKNVQYGSLLKYQGDQLAMEGRYFEAMHQYQRAIIQFDRDFNDRDIYQNPQRYNAGALFKQLFNTLIAKAEAFERVRPGEKNIKALNGALSAYHSAIQLAEFVKKTYDSDETRMFLDKVKDTVFDNPILLSLGLFKITGQKKYLEEAYVFDQLNKASILSLNIHEYELRDSLAESNETLKKEAFLRSSLTRLSLQVPHTTDSAALHRTNAAIRDDEIALGKLREKINHDPMWQQRRAIEFIPATAVVQQLIDKKTAVISYHLSENELMTLIITRDELVYDLQPVPEEFFANIDSFHLLLRSVQDQQYDPALAMQLYNVLISPVHTKLKGMDRLIIIPDNEFNYLPFEALQDSNKKYLLEEFAVQYQFSTALLGRETERSKEKSMFAFGQTATKDSFLLTANNYSILHLATHASVNNTDPLRSFIAFYPDSNDRDPRLYAQDIYGLDLDSIKLVILSACETTGGQLIKGDGMMSFSRAFGYAGCPNMIASLWKADDTTTAFITQQLHHYINEGHSRDKALQKARLDLLANDEIDPRFKTPAYWANMVFIGQYEPPYNPTPWLLIAAIASVVVAIVWIVTIKSNY